MPFEEIVMLLLMFKEKNALCQYLLGLHYVSGLTMATWKALQSIFLPLIEGLFIWTSLSGPWCGRRDGWGQDCFEQLLHIQSASVLLVSLESFGSFRKVAMLSYYYGLEMPWLRAWKGLCRKFDFWRHWEPFKLVFIIFITIPMTQIIWNKHYRFLRPEPFHQVISLHFIKKDPVRNIVKAYATPRGISFCNVSYRVLFIKCNEITWMKFLVIWHEAMVWWRLLEVKEATVLHHPRTTLAINKCSLNTDCVL